MLNQRIKKENNSVWIKKGTCLNCLDRGLVNLVQVSPDSSQVEELMVWPKKSVVTLQRVAHCWGNWRNEEQQGNKRRYSCEKWNILGSERSQFWRMVLLCTCLFWDTIIVWLCALLLLSSSVVVSCNKKWIIAMFWISFHSHNYAQLWLKKLLRRTQSLFTAFSFSSCL